MLLQLDRSNKFSYRKQIARKSWGDSYP